MRLWEWMGVGLAFALCACNAKTTSTADPDHGGGGSGGSSAGASGGSGGSGAGGSGTSGASRTSSTSGTTNILVDLMRDRSVERADLLLVIDNSLNMRDKQDLLRLALPRLLQRLITPDCVVTAADGSVAERERPGLDGTCPEGSKQEFPPLDDIHIGVISSSLGGHGGEICSPNSPASFNETQNDRAHLMPSVREGLPSSDGLGFLAWNPNATTSPELEAGVLLSIAAVGEEGCGFEATLEAWYRFLIDPSPPLEMANDGVFTTPVTDADGAILVDEVVLAQRSNFLRPDSLVAIVMLTDENDCSLIDGGISWRAATAQNGGQPFNLPAATAACDSNPNDSCCRSCALAEASPPAGCSPLLQDPGCEPRDPATDPLNLRCWDQKRRFGFDLLYPIERYIAGLKDPIVEDTHRCAGNECPLVANPLYTGNSLSPRDPSHVFLMGIVGVPWQDIASDNSLNDPSLLEYMTTQELTSSGRWDLIIGDSGSNVPPTDPLMLESAAPRSGTQPITGQALAPETSTNPQENAINGHEFANPDNDDLQYACIFPLVTPRDCSPTSGASACDCTESDIENNRPLCQPPGGGPAGTTQFYAKAYPGTRLLEALHAFGDNSVVASICPKATNGDARDPVFGYNPAMDALANRLSDALGPRCLPRALVPDPDTGQVACTIVEFTLTPNACDEARGRAEASAVFVAAAQRELEALGACAGNTGVPCDSYQACEISQLDGNALAACLNQPEYPEDEVPGYCYLDPEQGNGSAELLSDCPVSEPRRLRFVGEDTPTSGSLQFISCLGSG